MNSPQLNIAVLCGGQSSEHEISLISAHNIVEVLLKNPRYEISVIYITQEGEWSKINSAKDFLNGNWKNKTQLIALTPGQSKRPWKIVNQGHDERVDVVFPVLHGTKGEDGAMQGLLEILNIPYVGASVLSSAMCMNKIITKKILRASDIDLADWLVVTEENLPKIKTQEIIDELGLPLFVKPASQGSSVGVMKVKKVDELIPAIKNALKYDPEILLEEAIIGQEIECSVLGNENPKASMPGEVVPHDEFYSYRAKYLDKNGADLLIPARLLESTARQVQEIAVKAYKLLNVFGMARVDFFVTNTHDIYLNELNAIPGFTQISMYPKMWEASGLSYADLLDELIRLAIARFEKEKKLVHAYEQAKSEK